MPKHAQTWACAFDPDDRLTVELEHNGSFILTARQSGEDSVILLSKTAAEDMARSILNPLSFFIHNDSVPETDTMTFDSLRASIVSRYRDIRAAVSARFVRMKEAVIGHFAEHLDAWIAFPLLFAIFLLGAFFVLAGLAIFTSATLLGVLKLSALLAWGAAAACTIKHVIEEKVL